MKISSGTIVHPLSINTDSTRGLERSAFEPRRYLIANEMIGTKTMMQMRNVSATSAK